MLWLAWPVAAVVASAYRTIRKRKVEQEYAHRRPHGAGDIMEGAEPFTLAGNTGRALLVMHGSGDTPRSLQYFSSRMHEAGYTVRAALLPGHGRSPALFAATTAADYLAGAREELNVLRETHEWVGIVGLSMGGAIAASLAQESPDVRAIVLLAPYLIPTRDVTFGALTSPVWNLVNPYMAGGGEKSVHDPKAAADNRSYGTFSGGALRALLDTAHDGLQALEQIDTPVLVINSRMDNRIPNELAERALEHVRAPLEQHWVTNCGHIITADFCKAEVAETVLGFLASR